MTNSSREVRLRFRDRVVLEGAGAYAASKGAVTNLTRTLALDHAADGVRANCVCPGAVDTDMIHESWRVALPVDGGITAA